eukprot:scaffold62331_cov15-Tisochrysis_lutea.AAC.1
MDCSVLKRMLSDTQWWNCDILIASATLLKARAKAVPNWQRSYPQYEFMSADFMPNMDQHDCYMRTKADQLCEGFCVDTILFVPLLVECYWVLLVVEFAGGTIQ